MGVLNKDKNTGPMPIFGEITLADYIFEVENEAESNQLNMNSEQQSPGSEKHLSYARRRRNKDMRWMRKGINLDSVNAEYDRKEQMGGRKLRRLENARFLYSLVDIDDVCDDLSDIIPHSVTSFAKLFLDEQNMKAWNAFIEKEEEEQRRFLANDMECMRKEFEECCSLNGFIESEQKQIDPERRIGYPVYSASDSFARLNRRFRSFFLHKPLPREFMDESEAELRSFFSDHLAADKEWCSPILSSLERLIIHGLSQYLSLFSKSAKLNSKQKLVRVQNRNVLFRPPQETLVLHLCKRRGEYNIVSSVNKK